MQIPEPIRPYLDLIRLGVFLGLALALVGAGIYGGLRWNAGKLVAEQARVADLNRALSDFVEVFDDVNVAHQRNLELAAEQARLAHAAIERAEKRADDYQRELSDIDAELDEAKRDPDCRAILEKPSCAAFR